jgi:hypothetical protein
MCVPGCCKRKQGDQPDASSESAGITVHALASLPGGDRRRRIERLEPLSKTGVDGSAPNLLRGREQAIVNREFVGEDAVVLHVLEARQMRVDLRDVLIEVRTQPTGTG